MKPKSVSKVVPAVILIGITMFASCKKTSDEFSSSDSQNVSSESIADAYTNETVDLGDAVVSSVSSTTYGEGARVATTIDISNEVTDPRLNGATITLATNNGSTKDNPSGTITIDFRTGVTINGVTRKGQIILTYSGKKTVEGSTRILGYSNYSRNGIVFDNNMTFTSTNIQDSTEFHHVLTNGKLTFTDNTTITREADYNVTLNYSAVTLTLSASSATHSASGTTRAGSSYTTDITTPIVYDGACVATGVFLPVSGEKSVSVGTTGVLSYQINYGTGSCDDSITITFLGKTFTISVS